MDFTKLFELKADFGWTQVIAILAPIVAITTWWNQRRARIQLLPLLDAKISYEATDARDLRHRGLLLSWAIDISIVAVRLELLSG
jgi:hypothetical protein